MEQCTQFRERRTGMSHLLSTLQWMKRKNRKKWTITINMVMKRKSKKKMKKRNTKKEKTTFRLVVMMMTRKERNQSLKKEWQLS